MARNPPHEADLPGPLVWTLPEPPGRPAASLSRPAILAAALAVADAEGARALTMRRVATELGSSTPMSLYRYVGSKDGLVDLMIDAVYGEVGLPERPSGDWRADLEPLTRRTWAVIQHHLWFGELVHTAAVRSERPALLRLPVRSTGVRGTRRGRHDPDHRGHRQPSHRLGPPASRGEPDAPAHRTGH